jgi:hypothetical protein
VLEQRAPNRIIDTPTRSADEARSARIPDSEEVRQAVEDVERRASDEQLRARLAAAGFAGPEYAQFARDLAAYGIAVCMAKLNSGAFFQDCADLGRPCGAPPADWDAQDKRSLANETVAVALVRFREDGLVSGGWSPDGGASIKSYFIGACILAFPNVFRFWQRERERWNLISAALAGVPLAQQATATDPAALVLIDEQLSLGLRSLDNRTRNVLVLTELGFSQKEIAEVIGTSDRGVEGILYRHRTRLGEVPRGAGND